ncbi:RNA-directed DNA polymerase from mobile element jockey [Araneus ventricosus]|uniref:RNA-directed DNA polymerase from mobile element jockey n=1 Tax=Araneus ventricosus TaxID=182803 RepID=A0A4Y2AVP2_ARAVE|nr:RNA-directed DNA polymerase from mobile element jockey [Araneus ventricosus]
MILNLCFNLGIFPRRWKIAKVILIPKDGKDSSNYRSYRPICLLLLWGKLLDKLVTRRLVDYLEEKELLSEFQFGFRKGRSTTTGLRNIIDFIKLSKSQKKVSCLISLDIQNAFNSVSWGQIKQLLSQFKVPPKIGKLIDNFLQDRSVLLENGKNWEYNMGVPQGSSCGPMLWLLVINGVFNMRNIENDAYIQAYADDIVVKLRSTASYHFTNMSKPIMKNLEEWASSYKLSFSKEKTKYLMFKFRKKITHFPSIHLYGSRISHDKELKYLGIRLDPNLSFIPHLNKVQTNICKIYEKTRRIAKATWDLRPEIVKEIYS